QNERLAKLEEDRNSATSGQSELVRRKQRLATERDRLRADRPALAAEADTFKQTVAQIEQRRDAAETAMLAEERGVEGSGRAGRGPFWRAARDALRKVTAELEVAQKRLKVRTDRLDAIDARISGAEATIAGIDNQLAQLRGQAQTAEQLLNVVKTGAGDAGDEPLDPTAGVADLEKLRQRFRQAPTAERLAEMQRLCVAVQAAGQKIPTLAERAAAINCDPGAASETAQQVFALNAGIKALQANCLGGDKLPKQGGADALFGFARQCVQDSGLPSEATGDLRRQINIIELNRDDKAHRFVVTTNAFNDGNKLAYLALAIAIAIDALVFMSGLFGANALRSPLTDVPSHKGRSAKQLETIVRQGLKPNEAETAQIALEALIPRSGHAGTATGSYRGSGVADGWTHEAIVADMEHNRTALARALRAGATISAVQRDPGRPEAYLVRGEYVEFLNIVASEDASDSTARRDTADLRKILVISLQPHVGDHADVVLSHIRPSRAEAFPSEVAVGDIADPAHQAITRKALNAGATFDRLVELDDDRKANETYLIAGDFYRTLAMIAADSPRAGQIAGGPLASAAPIAVAAATAPGGIAVDARGTATPALTDKTALAARGGHVPAAEEPSPDLEDELLAEFLGALGMDEREHGWALTHVGSATNAEATLIRMAEQRDKLGQRLYGIINEADSAISQTDNVLAQRFSNRPAALQTLAGVRRDVEGLLPLLLLAPGGQYNSVLASTVAELEQAENNTDGGLRPDEVQELRRLKALQARTAREPSAQGTLGGLDAYLSASVDGADQTDMDTDSGVGRGKSATSLASSATNDGAEADATEAEEFPENVEPLRRQQVRSV
ncbi:MAG: hypothetical protein AAGG99_03225, partial [Pseudomonadota bacterium]